MTKLNKNNGITLIALVITVIVLMIIAGITILYGTNIMKTIKIEEVQTNLIAMKSKAKVIAEEVNAKVWTEKKEERNTKRAELYKTNYAMEAPGTMPSGVSQSPVAEASYECYEITEQTLEKMGLGDIFDQEQYDDGIRYYVLYDSGDYTKLDIIYEPGVTYENASYYSLSRLQEALDTESK